jgi:hypothetical protein
LLNLYESEATLPDDCGVAERTGVQMRKEQGVSMDDFSDIDLGIRVEGCGPIAAEDIEKKVQLKDWPYDRWMTVIKILSAREYQEVCTDLEVDIVGNGKDACDEEYFLAEDSARIRFIWGCNDDWQKGVSTCSR